MSAPGHLARHQLLQWVAELGAVTAAALAVHDGIPPASARARLAAAERQGELAAWRLLHGEPTLYTATRKGIRAAGTVGLSPGRVSPGGARHAIACCTAASVLALRFPEHLVLGEPAIRRRERELGRPLSAPAACLRSAGVATAHRPDLLLLARHEHAARPVAVEVELTVKAPDRLAAICRAWARSREVSGVLYLAADEVLAPLARAIATVRAESLVVAVSLQAIESAPAGPCRSAEPSQAVRSVAAVGVRQATETENDPCNR
jgi:hypothetical protein